MKQENNKQENLFSKYVLLCMYLQDLPTYQKSVSKVVDQCCQQFYELNKKQPTSKEEEIIMNLACEMTMEVVKALIKTNAIKIDIDNINLLNTLNNFVCLENYNLN